MKKLSRQQAAQFVLYAMAALCVVIVALGVIVAATNSSATRETQVSRLPTVEKNDQTLALIKDCTQPGGDCYARSLRQTADAVGDINQVVILAASCASGPAQRTFEQIQACVIARLADEPN